MPRGSSRWPRACGVRSSPRWRGAAPEDIERAGEALKGAERSRIHTFIATSDLHLAKKLNISREQCLASAVAAVKQARDYTDDVQFSAEDATRSDMDFLCTIVEAVIKAGATTINLPDTVGYATPDEIHDFFVTIQATVPNADKAVFSAHCHDDLGLAVANTHAAVTAGVRQVECTINGIGERAGNASLEEIVMGMRVRPDRLPFTTGIRSEQLFPTSQLLSSLTGQHVQANKAIVGRNAFAHEAGIHQDGMLKDRRTYEIMSPADVGVPQTTLVLGKHSGRHAVKHRCEAIGHTLTRLELDQVYRRIIALCDAQKTITDDDLLAVIQDVSSSPAREASPEGLTLRLERIVGSRLQSLDLDPSSSVRQLAERHPALEQLVDVVRLVVRHVLHLEVQVVVRELRVPRLAVPLGGRQPLELPAQRLALAKILGQHLRGRPLRQRDEHLVAVGILVRHDGGLFGQHPREALAEDRLHAAEVADQLFHRPLAGHAPRRERRFVQSRRQPPHLGRLRAQSLHQRQMDGMFVAVRWW